MVILDYYVYQKSQLEKKRRKKVKYRQMPQMPSVNMTSTPKPFTNLAGKGSSEQDCVNVMLLFSSLSRRATRLVSSPLPAVGGIIQYPNPKRNLHYQLLHVHGRARSTPLQSSAVPLLLQRHNSTETTFSIPPTSEVGPAPPISSDVFESSAHELWAADAARMLGEGETLASLGLGNYTPVGLIQHLLDFVHSTVGLPWWTAIVATTVCIKLAFIPCTLYARKHAIKMREIDPQVSKLKEKQKVFMLAGNVDLANHEKEKMKLLFKQHGVSPVLVMIPTIFQASVMISFFMAIRQMAYAPVSSMMTGGSLWFVDLTMSDPTFMLPIISSALLIANLEVHSHIVILVVGRVMVREGIPVLPL